MMSKAAYYAQVAEKTAGRLTGSREEWAAFLRFAARFYKYAFPEQLLLYAQRPGAAACAEYEVWQRLGRYVRRGAKGIALLDSGSMQLRYVFDAADTGGGAPLRLWQYRREYREAVSAALEARFGAPVSSPEQLTELASGLAGAYWEGHSRDVLPIVDGSRLEGYDGFTIGVQFRKAAAVSIACTVLARCGGEPETHFTHEDFLPVFDFDTPDLVTELGTAVCQGSEQLLRQIERTVKRLEREKSAERSSYGERTDLHPERGLPLSGSDSGGAAGAASGQVRQDAEGISGGISSGAIQPADSQREIVVALPGDPGGGGKPDGTADAQAGGSGGGHRAAEGQQPHEVGGPHERLQGPGGGDHPDGTDLQLSLFQSREETLADTKMSASVSVSVEDLDRILRLGTGFAGGRNRLAELYRQSPDEKTAVAALKKEYGTGGRSYTFLDGREGFVEHSPAMGIRLQWYDPSGEAVISWTDAEKRIRQLISEGSYLSPEEMEAYERNHLETEDASPPAIRQTVDRRGEIQPEASEERSYEPRSEPYVFCEWSESSIFADRHSYSIREFDRLMKQADDARTAGAKAAMEKYGSRQKWYDADDPEYSAFLGYDKVKFTLVLSDGRTFTERQDIGDGDGGLLDFLGKYESYQELLPSLREAVRAEEARPEPDAEAAEHILSAQREENPFADAEKWVADYQSRTEAAIAALEPEQQRIVDAMRTAGFFYDPLSSTALDPLIFRAGGLTGGYPTSFKTWDEAYAFIDRAELKDTPGLREQVQSVLHPDSTLAQNTRKLDAGPASDQVDPKPKPKVTATAETIYPGDKNGLPFDVVVEKLHFDEPEQEQPEQPTAHNFRITDDHLGEGGPKAKFRANMDAINLLHELEVDGRDATPEEQEILSRYVGWGGLADAFDEQKPQWADEFRELRTALSPEEYAAARASTPNAHYTSPTVIRAIYDAVERMGFRTGNILEPSMGVGNFFGLLPESIQGSRLYGVELDSITGRIAQKLYSKNS